MAATFGAKASVQVVGANMNLKQQESKQQQHAVLYTKVAVQRLQLMSTIKT